MPVSQEYLEYILDLLKTFGPVNSRRMFGGAGIYHESVFSVSSRMTPFISRWMTGTAQIMKRQGPGRSGPSGPLR